MKKTDYEQFQKKYALRVKRLKAIAHPARLFIAEQLKKGDLCVSEITSLVNLDMSTVSRHLAILREAGIVDSTRDNTTIHYKLITPCILEVVQCAEKAIADHEKEKPPLP